MIQKLLFQFIKFSRENWWIYLLFIIAFSLILYSWKWNLYELSAVFFLNILGNIYMLLMQDSFKDNKFKTGCIFLLIWNILYFLLALYSFLVNNELQYLLWQMWFQLAWIKTIMYFYYGKNLKFLNGVFMSILAVLLVLIGIEFLSLSWYAHIQSIWFAVTVIWLSAESDTKRYFLIFLWVVITAIGSFLGLYVNYLDWNIFWITISFAILSLSSALYYTKLFPIYISRVKNT